jgi:hypothetical protein
MARGFMDVRRAMEAMDGAYPNDPNRSILSLNKRPKGEISQRLEITLLSWWEVLLTFGILFCPQVGTKRTILT